jgi:hypothetical protein
MVGGSLGVAGGSAVAINQYPAIIAGELSDAHYLAAYADGGSDGRPANEALRKLGERQVT